MLFFEKIFQNRKNEKAALAKMQEKSRKPGIVLWAQG